MLSHSVDDEWEMFVTDPTYEGRMLRQTDEQSIDNMLGTTTDTTDSTICPPSGNIYISTKSKIAYLTTPVNLGKVFWKLPIMRYDTHANGIVKKQMKFNSTTQEEVDEIEKNMEGEFYVVNQIMTSIRNPSGKKDWFKDVRKISVGLSMKDVTTYRDKKKCAFYNCFVIIIRIKIEDTTDDSYNTFREFHVKIFNTGKIEIPGIQTEYHLKTVMDQVLMYLRNIVEEPISYIGECDTVLINSNFNCGFYIHREILFDILKSKYNLQCIFDPCSYPGIQCKFYYDKKRTVQDGTRPDIEDGIKDPDLVTVSFMIFRTGSILIVGMCDENVLELVYTFIKGLVKDEFTNICQRLATVEELTFVKKKNAKVRKRYIVFDESLHICDQNNTILQAITEK
jgi:hypothetical protein